jgi:type VI secretion system protein
MPHERTLLERLAEPGPQASRTVAADSRSLADSILRHLQRMLNTRQGSTPIQPEYGMPDITDCAESLPEALDGVRRLIKSSLEQFEPRLGRVKVTSQPSPDDLSLHFAISGEMQSGGERVPVFFSTRVSPLRGVEVTTGRDPNELEDGELARRGRGARPHPEQRSRRPNAW